MPLLDYVDSLYEELNLEDFCLIGCQNLFGSTVNLIQRLISKGLNPSNTFILGKVYTGHTEVASQLKMLGVFVSQYTFAYNPFVSYDEQFSEYVAYFLEEVQERIENQNIRGVIFLDEGAQLLKCSKGLFDDKSVVGVEQSTPLRTLNGYQINYPYISIARSQAKLEVETPMIAGAVLDSIKAGYPNLLSKKMLIIGQGPLGNHLKECIRASGGEAIGYDHHSSKSDLSGKLSDHLSQYEVVVGCNYNQSLDVDQIKSLKSGTFLVNVGLSDRAFPSAYLRSRSLHKIENCHQDIETKDGVFLINSGFPVNFNGAIHSVPPQKIQITRALLLISIYELLRSSPLGHELSYEMQLDLVQKFEEFYPQEMLPPLSV